MKRSLLCTILILAGALVALAPKPAAADVAVTNLRLGRDASADPAMSAFLPGTRSVFARFDYDEAADHRMAVIVMVHGGVRAHRSEGRYSGKGSEAVEISGTGVFHQVAQQQLDAANNARASARLAATQQYGLEENLFQVQASINRVDSALIVLDGIHSSAVDGRLLAEIADASKQVSRLLERVTRAPDDDEKRELAEAMDEPLGEMVEHATELVDAAAGATNVPLPVSGEKWEYVVSVTVNDSPALSTEFIVHGGLIHLPVVARQ